MNIKAHPKQFKEQLKQRKLDRKAWDNASLWQKDQVTKEFKLTRNITITIKQDKWIQYKLPTRWVKSPLVEGGWPIVHFKQAEMQ